MSEYGLTLQEYKDLVALVLENREVDADMPRTLKRAFLEMQKTVDQKLRRELTFAQDENIFLHVAYNTDEVRKNYIVGVFGASGAGKSYSICQTILRDPAADAYPRIYLIGAVGEDDPSYDPLRDFFKEKYVYRNPMDMTPADRQMRNYERGACVILDDIDSTADPRVRKATQLFRDRLLEKARHKSLRIWSSVHLFNSYRETSKLRNSSRWLYLFPRSIPRTLLQVLDQTFGWKRQKRQLLLKKCQQDGRLCVISKQHPQFLLTSKRIILL
jgi:hypothetical protein